MAGAPRTPWGGVVHHNLLHGTSGTAREELGQANSATLLVWLRWVIRARKQTAAANEQPSNFKALILITGIHTYVSILVVSPAFHTALRCTRLPIPFPSASDAPSFAEHLNGDQFPKGRSTRLRKSTAKQASASSTLGRESQALTQQEMQNMSHYRSILKAGPSDPPKKGASPLHSCCIYPTGSTARMDQAAFTAFRWSIASFISPITPHSPSYPQERARPETEHSSVHRQQSPRCSLGRTCCFPPQQLRPIQPKKELVMPSGEQKLQLSLSRPLFCCLCQLPSPTSLACPLCFRQHLNETPGTAAATRLVCTVQRKRSTFGADFFFPTNRRVKVESGGRT